MDTALRTEIKRRLAGWRNTEPALADVLNAVKTWRRADPDDADLALAESLLMPSVKGFSAFAKPDMNAVFGSLAKAVKVGSLPPKDPDGLLMDAKRLWNTAKSILQAANRQKRELGNPVPRHVQMWTNGLKDDWLAFVRNYPDFTRNAGPYVNRITALLGRPFDKKDRIGPLQQIANEFYRLLSFVEGMSGGQPSTSANPQLTRQIGIMHRFAQGLINDVRSGNKEHLNANLAGLGRMWRQHFASDRTLADNEYARRLDAMLSPSGIQKGAGSVRYLQDVVSTLARLMRSAS